MVYCATVKPRDNPKAKSLLILLISRETEERKVGSARYEILFCVTIIIIIRSRSRSSSSNNKKSLNNASINR